VALRVSMLGGMRTSAPRKESARADSQATGVEGPLQSPSSRPMNGASWAENLPAKEGVCEADSLAAGAGRTLQLPSSRPNTKSTRVDSASGNARFVSVPRQVAWSALGGGYVAKNDSLRSHSSPSAGCRRGASSRLTARSVREGLV